MLLKLEQNRMVKTAHKMARFLFLFLFLFFLTNKHVLKTTFEKALTPFWNVGYVSVAEIIV